MDNTPSSKTPTEPHLEPQVLRVKRPWSVTLLALGVLIIAVINLTRFIMSLRYWSFLASQQSYLSVYLVITGFIWAAAGGWLFWGLWKPEGWAPKLLEAEALTYALYYWLDLLFVRDHPLYTAPLAIRAILPANWQFSAGVTVVCLVYIVWALGRLKVKDYFDRARPEKQASQVPGASE
jgi:hypothetical protein